MVSNCNTFVFVKEGDSCASITATRGITFAKLLELNPSIGSNCQGLWANVNVCVGVIGGSSPPPTTTAPGNGIQTPSPVRTGMTKSCNKFYLVKSGNACATIASSNSITLSNFYAWNPDAGTTCTGLWLDTYVCVGIIGSTPTIPTTTTSAGNGIKTPTPIQPGMVGNCDDFYLTKIGDVCSAIVTTKGISVAQFVSWNPQVKSDCSGMWANAYVCVSIVGHTPTLTNPGNGISTPSPIQSGMVTNCKTFYLVKTGETCATITKAKGITLANFSKWNSAVKSDCTGLWANTYACIATL